MAAKMPSRAERMARIKKNYAKLNKKKRRNLGPKNYGPGTAVARKGKTGTTQPISTSKKKPRTTKEDVAEQKRILGKGVYK
jgi:hypothetical protein